MRKIATVTMAAVSAVALFSASVSAETLTFMTGPAGGSWYPLGGAMKNIFEKENSDISIQLRPGAGPVNLRGVQSGKAEISFGSIVVTVDAIDGREPFEEKHNNICNIGSMYANYIQIITTDISIDSLDGAKGKRLTTMPRGSQAEQIARTALKSAGLTFDDMQKVDLISISDSVNMMKDGQTDVFFTYTSMPSGSIIDLTNSRDVKFLPITDEQFEAMKEVNPGWSRMVIPAGAYPGVNEDVPVAGSPMHVIVHCGLPDETVYKLTKALAENVTELGHVNAALKEWTVEQLGQETGTPFHPGAEKYYREVGVIN